MKKSDAYKAAQMAILAYECLTDIKKLEVLAVLIDDERLAKLLEYQVEEQK